jgi:hypothetical protein
MARKEKLKDLAQVIRDNPGCVAVIDNDSWTLHRESPGNCPHDDDTQADRWLEANVLACDSDISPLGDGGYGSGNCYGGDILQALAQIVGIHVESV